MSTSPDLSPLALQRVGNRLRFTLAARGEELPELPANYEELLTTHLAHLLKDPAPYTAEVNLEGCPGISSRQLGSLIALQKILRPRFGRIPITGVSDSVRHLLELTRTDQLFDVS